MATSGQIQTNTAFGYVRLAWSQSSQSIENNTTTINYTLSIYRSSNISSSAAKNYSIVINGVTVASGTTSIGGSGTKTIKTGTTTIPHNADGTKTFSYSFSQQIDITWSGSWIGTVTGSGSGTLNTVPRATTPVLSPSNVTLGQTLTITLNRASSAFTHVLTYVFGGASGTIASSAGTSHSWTVPLTLANQIPNAATGTGTLTCKTYNGSTLIGTKSVSFVVTVPSSVIPTISAVSISEAVSGIASKFNAFVQHKSKLAIATTAAGAYSSTIKTCTVTLRDSSNVIFATYNGLNVTTEIIPIGGTVKIGVAVTDSRGRSASVIYDRTILEYEPPQIFGFSAFRCDSTGAADYEGEYLNISLNFNISALNNLNDKYYEVVYKVKDAETWSGTLASGNIYSRNDSFVTTNVFSGDNAYDIALRVWDYFTTSADGIIAHVEIPTAFTLFDCRSTGKGIAFGKVSEKDCMEIALDVELTGEFVQEEIQTPTLQNSWVNYGASYRGAGYFKDKCGVVHLCGLIKSGSTAAETVIFTLPSGYRPAVSEKFFAVSMNAICVIDVYGTGNVAIKTGANSGWLSLSGISFKAGS